MPNEDELSFVSFNQDSKCLQIAHRYGYQFYLLEQCLSENLQVDCARELPETKIVERLFTSGLVILVTNKQPRSVHVCHLHNQKNIYDQMFSSSILSVKLNPERIVVCLEEAIFIYNLKDLKHQHTITGITSNKTGLMDLSPTVSYIAYPGSSTTGKVQIFHAGTEHMKSERTFVAHESPLACLKFNNEGSLLVTASTRGTVIRVFSVLQGTRLYEFRRGVTRSASIYSLSFSADSTLLVSSSNTETVHVFKLSQHAKSENQESSASGWMGYLTSYLPVQMNDLVLMEKSFATATLPVAGKSYAALPIVNGTTYLTVATYRGYLYIYRLNEDGGVCDLIRQHKIGPFHENSELENPRLNAPPTNHAV